MGEQRVNAELNMEQNKPEKKQVLRTSDVYRVNKNVPKRFNNPDCFQGYRKLNVHPLYQTTNQIYGSRKPTLHEMPTSFHGSRRKFSDHILRSGMFRDNGFNTSVEKSRITGPNTINVMEDRITFHHLLYTKENNQAETNMD